MADAVHDLGDSLSIGLAWGLERLGKRHPDAHFTYGYRRFSVIGAAINAMILVIGAVWIVSESLARLAEPVMPMAEGMVALAVLGVAVNGWAVLRLRGGKGLNQQVLSWHLLEDVLGWLAVLLVAIVLCFVELPMLDPLLALLIAALVGVNAARMLWQAVRVFAQATPDPEQLQGIRAQLLALDEVADLHHMHLWSLDGERHVLSVHLVLGQAQDLARHKAIKQQVAAVLAPYAVHHTTVEIETPDETCRDQPS
jgi:cobalt-zinc-cadmium efflux system protein